MGRKIDEEKLDILLDDTEWDSLLEEDDEFDAAVKEEYMRDAEEIEKSLFPDGMPQETKSSEEETRASYKKLVELLKKNGIYREDAAAGCAACGAGQRSTLEFAGNNAVIALDRNSIVHARKSIASVKQIRKNGGHTTTGYFKAVRVAGIGVACLLGVFAASMTSEANRAYFVRTVKYLTGNAAHIVVDNDEIDESLHEEAEVREIIERTLNVKVPEIKYRPESFEFQDYYIIKETHSASIEYIYDNEIINWDICDCSDNATSQIYASHGNGENVFYVEQGDTEVMVIETIDEGEEKETYTAQWEKETAFYQFSGRIDKTTLIKIIENMKYY